MTILENGFGIVVIQDVTSEEAPQRLVDELTTPTLPNVKSWFGNRGNWKCVVSPQFSSPTKDRCHLAFLYDTAKDVHLTNSGFAWTLSNSNDEQMVPLFLAEFKVHELDFTIANIYMELLEYSVEESEALVMPVTTLLRQYEEQGSESLLLAGHFGMSPDGAAMTSLYSAQFFPLLSVEDFTDISAQNVAGSSCTENIWLSQALRGVHRGEAKVIRTGLTNLWIPNGLWGWGGTASSHCPVVTEFRIDGSATEERRSS